MKCYNVKCLTKDGKVINEGVMCSGFDEAERCAVKSLKEGCNIEVTVIGIDIVEGI